jgi:hypothetical protein
MTMVAFMMVACTSMAWLSARVTAPLEVRA